MGIKITKKISKDDFVASVQRATKPRHATGSIRRITAEQKALNREYTVEASCGSNNGSAVIEWCDNGKREIVNHLSLVVGTRVG